MSLGARTSRSASTAKSMDRRADLEVRAPTRLGIGSYTYGWAVAAGLSATDLIDRAVALGVDLVQLCDNLPAETWTDEAVAALLAHARAAGVAIELGTRGLDADHLARFVTLAERVGSPILRLVIDSPGDEPSPAQAVARLRPLLPRLEQTGVTLAIENHDRFPVATLAALVDELNGDGPERVGICLDTVNSLGVLETPRQVVAELAPRCVCLHCKDFDIQRLPHLQGFIIEGRPAGEGRLDIPWVLDQLRAAGRTPNTILEQWAPPLADPAATIAREAEWAERGIRYLRERIGPTC